ncbi:MAG: S41 family peptidase [Bacteroidota bacterium]|jgi:carboxyl-terminal processing protease
MKFKATPLLFVLFLFAMDQYGVAQSPSTYKFDALLQMIRFGYVDTVNEEQLTEEAIRAVLKKLDPHSVYIPAKELKEMNEPLVGKFEGVGIQFNIFEDTIMVTQTIAGGPSEKLGVRAGDRIVEIDDEKVAGVKFTNNDVMKRLRGDKGTKVKVEILRRGEPELLEFMITRDKIPIFSVDAAYMADQETGYIKISRFADATVEEFKQALKKLQDSGMKNLILDLSGNGGGYLNRAIELADEFLEKDKLIVYTEGLNSPKQSFSSSETGGFEKGKLVVIIDETSASASEIVSGAVQDHDRGLIIGRRSFAKGLVQKPMPLPDGSAIRLTTARYHTPSGRCIQKPYEKGDEYDEDISNRFKNGELYSADSIKFNDSLMYKTTGGRKVFGGGGVMPDIFVPLDTAYNSKYLSDLQRKSVLFEFALSYTDRNRDMLNSRYPNIGVYKKDFQVDEDLMNELVAFGEKKGVPLDSAGYATSKPLMKVQLRALIARDLWNIESYWQIINDKNDFFRMAMKCMYDETFVKNGIGVVDTSKKTKPSKGKK